MKFSFMNINYLHKEKEIFLNATIYQITPLYPLIKPQLTRNIYPYGTCHSHSVAPWCKTADTTSQVLPIHWEFCVCGRVLISGVDTSQWDNVTADKRIRHWLLDVVWQVAWRGLLWLVGPEVFVSGHVCHHGCEVGDVDWLVVNLCCIRATRVLLVTGL